MIEGLILWIFGWTAATGINLLADQLPFSRRLSHPVCVHCDQPMGWLEYIFLESCKLCGATRSFRNYLAQWIIPITFVTVGFWKPERLSSIEALTIVIYFSLVLIIDIEHHLILHPISLVGVVIGLIIGTRLHGLLLTIYGGAAGFGMMLALYFLGDLFSRLMAKRRGEPIEEVALGFGDVNFSGVLGLLLGWPGITLGLLLAILAGGIMSGLVILIMIIRKRYQAYTALPYAPFLILAGSVLLFRP